MAGVERVPSLPQCFSRQVPPKQKPTESLYLMAAGVHSAESLRAEANLSPLMSNTHLC